MNHVEDPDNWLPARTKLVSRVGHRLLVVSLSLSLSLSFVWSSFMSLPLNPLPLPLDLPLPRPLPPLESLATAGVTVLALTSETFPHGQQDGKSLDFSS